MKAARGSRVSQGSANARVGVRLRRSQPTTQSAIDYRAGD